MGRLLLARLAVAANLIFCGYPAAGQESDSTSEFWPKIDAFLNLDLKSRLYFMYAATRSENLGTFAEGQTGVHFDIYGAPALRSHGIFRFLDESRSKSLLLRLGYLYSRPKNDSGLSTEHVATVQVTGRIHLPAGLLFSDRNRFDMRWENGSPRHRYRNRLRLERSFRAGPFELTPYGHAEIFYEFHPREWTRLRYAAGGEWYLAKNVALEAYFLRQNTWAHVPQFVNATGLALRLYVR